MATVNAPSSRARCRAAQTLRLFPEVEMPITTSPGYTQRLQLAVEDFGEAAIVGDGGQHRSIGGKSDGWQGPAFAAKASYEFGRQVLCIGGAAAVATP